MKKRVAAALLAVLFLLTVFPANAQADSERFRSMEDLASYLFYDCAYMLAEEIEFGYMQSMDYVFADGFPWKMLYSCGMLDMDVHVDRTHRRVEITNIEYYPGFKAAQAWELEAVGMLDADERTMLAHAEAMVEDACRYAQSPYQVLVNLHDALAGRVTYTLGEDRADGWVLEDTAIGALVYGKAECDGYSDAFYLLCTLAGFPARMISGYADNGTGEGYESHMWNLIWWENGWYHVDVTWDDPDWEKDASLVKYAYLLMGSSLIGDHQWEADHLVCQPQEYTDWNSYYYTCDNTGITYGAYYASLKEAANYAAYMQRNYDREIIHVMVDGDYDQEYDVIHEALNDGGVRRRYVWTNKCARGDYTCITLYIE